MAGKGRKKSNAFERFNNARAEKFELENRKTKREVISRDQIEEEWLKMIGHVSHGFKSLPSRMARVLVGIDDPAEIYEIIERDVNQVLESLANLGLELEAEVPDLPEEEPEEEQAEAEPETEPEEEAPKKTRRKKTKKDEEEK